MELTRLWCPSPVRERLGCGSLRAQTRQRPGSLRVVQNPAGDVERIREASLVEQERPALCEGDETRPLAAGFRCLLYGSLETVQHRAGLGEQPQASLQSRHPRTQVRVVQLAIGPAEDLVLRLSQLSLVVHVST